MRKFLALLVTVVAIVGCGQPRSKPFRATLVERDGRRVFIRDTRQDG